jgi:hypothetical protein
MRGGFTTISPPLRGGDEGEGVGMKKAGAITDPCLCTSILLSSPITYSKNI